VRELSGDAGTYEVQTPVATATAAGTAFSVVCRVITECAFSIIEGLVQVVLPDGTAFDLEAGEELVVDAEADPDDLEPTSSGVEALGTDPWIAENLEADGDGAAGDNPDGPGSDEDGDDAQAPITNLDARGRVVSASPLTDDLRAGLVAPGVISLTDEIVSLENADVNFGLSIDCDDECVITSVDRLFFIAIYGERVDESRMQSRVGMSFGPDGEIQPEPQPNLRVAFDVPAPLDVDGPVRRGELRGTFTCGPGEVGFTLAFEVEMLADGSGQAVTGSLRFDTEVHRFGDIACWTPSVEFDSAANEASASDGPGSAPGGA
jgi:hypothetical protein